MIRLNEKYGIETSENATYTLVEVRVNKTGKNKGEEYKRPIAYTGSVVQALLIFRDRFIHEALKDADMSLVEAVSMVRESCNEVKELIERAIPEAKVTIE